MVGFVSKQMKIDQKVKLCQNLREAVVVQVLSVSSPLSRLPWQGKHLDFDQPIIFQMWFGKLQQVHQIPWQQLTWWTQGSLRLPGIVSLQLIIVPFLLFLPLWIQLIFLSFYGHVKNTKSFSSPSKSPRNTDFMFISSFPVFPQTFDCLLAGTHPL